MPSPTYTVIPAPGTLMPYFLADFDKIDFTWEDTEQNRTVTFAITDDHGNTSSVSEKYYAVNNKITVQDVSELLRPYFDLSDHPGLTGFATLGLKSLAESRCVSVLTTLTGTNSHTFQLPHTVVYSNAPTGVGQNGNYPGNAQFLKNRFLSRCDLHTVTANQPCAVSFFANGAERLVVKLQHYVDGDAVQTQVVSIDVTTNYNVNTYNFTLQQLATLANIDVEDVIFADVQLFLTSALGDSIRFMHEPRRRPQERTFAFIGAMGEPEFMVLTGQEGREADFEGVFLMEHNDYRKADTTLRLLHNSYTGPLSEGERLLMWDMAASPWVYVIEDGQLREVTITEVELTDSLPHREPIGYRVKWRYTSEREQRTFSRVQNIPNVEEATVLDDNSVEVMPEDSSDDSSYYEEDNEG